MTGKLCIHVVDDDQAALESTALLLRTLGFGAVEWNSGTAFIAGCDPAEIDCLLLDSRMPGMSGERVLAEMAARGMAVPVICMSGHAVPPASEMGSVAFLEKPFRVAELRAAIDTARAAFRANATGPGAGDGNP